MQLFLVYARRKKRSYAGHNEYFCNAAWAEKNKYKRVDYIFLKPLIEKIPSFIKKMNRKIGLLKNLRYIA